MFIAQHRGAVAAALMERGAPAMPLRRKDHLHAQMPGAVANLHLVPLLWLCIAVSKYRLDVELLHIAPALGLAQRNQNVPAISLLIAVRHHAGRAAVLGKQVTLAPCMVLKRNNVVLQKAYLLPLVEVGQMAMGVHELQCGFIVQNLVHAAVALAGEECIEAVGHVKDGLPFAQ